MIERVVFLDIDGVLNSERFFESRSRGRFIANEDIAGDLDEKLVKRFSKLIEDTGALVVLSSDWRLAPQKPGLQSTNSALRERGAAFDIYDTTPVLTEAERIERFGVQWQGNYTPRGFEIQSWLDANGSVSAFAIVDDEPDMRHLSEYLVQTDPNVGLSNGDCEMVKRILSKGVREHHA